MKTQELMSCINGGSVIYATAPDFLKSSITWFEDNELPHHIVEIYRQDDMDEIIVTFVPQKEFENKVYNTDFSETIIKEDEENFINELCQNSAIFTEKYPYIYTNL